MRLLSSIACSYWPKNILEAPGLLPRCPTLNHYPPLCNSDVPRGRRGAGRTSSVSSAAWHRDGEHRQASEVADPADRGYVEAMPPGPERDVVIASLAAYRAPEALHTGDPLPAVTVRQAVGLARSPGARSLWASRTKAGRCCSSSAAYT